ncbi:MAG: hypothetical protein KatS3mg054_1076 [Chloroflexus sp.]|nr:MAG: hypothetical protein KatS3mg054_1076 [Chloroflexus sp.]
MNKVIRKLFRSWRSKDTPREYPDRAFVCSREVWMPKSANRPITLRLPLIGYCPPEQVGRQLLQSGLQWFWCCWWKERYPWDYSVQLLTEASLPTFIADAEREEDMFLYFLDIYGFLPDVEVSLDHAFIGTQMLRFYERSSSALQVMLERLDDEPEECTYVSVSRDWNRVVPVRQLLGAWGIDEQFSGFRVVRGEHWVLTGTVDLYRRWLGGKR